VIGMGGKLGGVSGQTLGAGWSPTPTARQHWDAASHGAGVAALFAGLAVGVLAAQDPLLAAAALVALGGVNAGFGLPRQGPFGPLLLGCVSLIVAALLAWSLGGAAGVAGAALVWRVVAESRWWATEAQRLGAPQGALAGLGPCIPALAGLGLAFARPENSFAGVSLPALPLLLGATLAAAAGVCMLIWVASRLAQRHLGEPLGARDGRLALMGLLWPATLAFAPDAAAGLAALAGCRLALAAASRARPRQPLAV